MPESNKMLRILDDGTRSPTPCYMILLQLPVHSRWCCDQRKSPLMTMKRSRLTATILRMTAWAHAMMMTAFLSLWRSPMPSHHVQRSTRHSCLRLRLHIKPSCLNTSVVPPTASTSSPLEMLWRSIQAALTVSSSMVLLVSNHLSPFFQTSPLLLIMLSKRWYWVRKTY